VGPPLGAAGGALAAPGPGVPLLAFRRLSTTASHTAEERAALLRSAPAVISAEGVSKAFRLPHQKYDTLKERALHPFAARTVDTLQALDDVSFEVRSGEFFGIVGRNGSGKSTLLKCLAGIYALDGGDVRVSGRLSAFVELGVGFNPNLTARDNVVINAIMLGLTRKQARERFDEIIAFAELEDFVDLKLKNYSSGMAVRLGFSVAIQVDADVLLIDEVLAVGDASFQAKCFDQFERMMDEGRTFVFVTHDMAAVERFCDRAMLLEEGQVVDIGEPGTIARKYGELNFGFTADGVPTGGQGARVVGAWCEDADGEPIVSQRQGERCTACFEVEFLESVESPEFAITFRNDVRHTIFVADSRRVGVPPGQFDAGERATVRFAFDNWLAPSRYTLTPSVATGRRRLGAGIDAASLVVQGEGSPTGGVADLPTELEVERQ
jgi:ABC-type polysaccharide/polyol phosphate transport system ATPase subunit